MALGALVGIVVHILYLSTYVSAIGFTTDLIHRDSPLSPFYNPSLTKYDRLHNAVQRSLNRVNYFINRSKMEAPMLPGNVQYSMKLKLGTPPVELVGMADTASDLIWTQCLPCNQCFQQNLPFYDPQQSSSYKTILCDSDECKSLQIHRCGQDDICEYYYSYVDHSYTEGNLATETFTIGMSVVPNVVFGCSHSTVGEFDKTDSGLVGLGSGRFSLVSQLGVDGRKFSYCLTQVESATSKISFGSDAVVSGDGFTSTRMIIKDGMYYLILDSFTVGNKIIAVAQNSEENLIIDSGTPCIFVPQSVLDGLIQAFNQVITLPRVDDPSDNEFQLCYKFDGSEDAGNQLTTLTANFRDADVVLQSYNVFTYVNDDTVCLQMVPNESYLIFGSAAQLNFLVGYDLDAQLVSFKPTDCAQQQ